MAEPDYGNPQDLNLYGYVWNNPLRYTDPTGHRTCESYKVYDSCLSEQQVTILIKGEQQANKNKDKNKDKDKENEGPELLEGILHTGEGLVFAAAGTAALVASFSAGPIALISAPGFLVVIAAGTNWGLVGIQEINAALHPNENIKVDYLPLVHLFFPNALSGRSRP